MSDIHAFVDLVRHTQQMSDAVPLHAPVFRGREREYVGQAIDSTFVSSVGPFVDCFERNLAEYTGVPSSVAVVNGTSALQAALHLVGVKPGDEVLTQSLTFVATANAIHWNHAHPVFLDVDRDTMGLSPRALQQFIDAQTEQREDGCYNQRTGRRIAACVPMHTFGFLCRMEEIVDLCLGSGIPVVEDAAEALGSFSAGRSAGTFGDIGVFSFNGNKIITAGGGGALVSRNEGLMVAAKHLTTTAKVSHPWAFHHDRQGFNFRMPNLNAALVTAQLEQLPVFLEAKKALYEEYSAHLESIGYALVPIPDTTTQWNYWLMSIELASQEERDDFLQQTNADGIMTRPVWTLMHRLPMYGACERDDQTVAEELEQRIVNIPSSVR